LPDRPAQQMSNQMMPVANAENGFAAGQKRGFDGRTGIVIDAGRTARDDDAAGMAQLLNGGFARKDFRGNAEFSNFPGDQMTILTAGIEYCDLRG
jgi:hypothetical protein